MGVVETNGNRLIPSNIVKVVNDQTLKRSIGLLGDESTIDTIFTPVTSGKVTFDFKSSRFLFRRYSPYIVTASTYADRNKYGPAFRHLTMSQCR